MRYLVFAWLGLICCTARADAGRFDLAGPKIDVRVTRAGVALPIAMVPNLQAGDQLWLHPDLPATQSVHYLLIVAFLRGTTNPPPDSWFTRVETWKKDVRAEGVTVTVPAEAEQAILFMAPETGGDFGTLKSAVQGRPGVFVRASQDLTEAGFEEARVDRYLAGMRQVATAEPAVQVEHSNLLARTLALKPNPDCLKRPLDQQYTCLTQTGTQSLLDDGHGVSLVAALSTGAGSDFINQASTTRLAGGGEYSAYVGALIDMVRVMNSFHTAQYQYIPALAAPTAEELNLKLNTPPSFHNPKSVLVIGLPAVQKAVPPPLRAPDAKHVACTLDPHVVLPFEGAPLVFSTAFAHELAVTPDVAGAASLPLVADAFAGGLTLAPPGPKRRELPVERVPGMPAAKPVAATVPKPAGPGEAVPAKLSGMWGFDHFEGPAVLLQQTPGEGWHVLNADKTPLILGRAGTVAVGATGTACVETVEVDPGDTKAVWKADAADKSVVNVSLDAKELAKPGARELKVQQFGKKAPDAVMVATFAEPARLEGLRVHVADAGAELDGSGLEQVRSVEVKGESFVPGGDASGGDTAKETLPLKLPADAKAGGLKAGEKVQAKVTLEDGRVLEVGTVVLPARPVLTLVRLRAVAVPVAGPLQIALASQDEVPLGAELVFSLKSKAAFGRAEKVEIAMAPSEGEDGVSKKLSLADGGLVLAGAHTVLVNFDPLRTFGGCTFGMLRLRAVAEDGAGAPIEGEWLPLAKVVRLPGLTGLTCPPDVTAGCVLSGSGLYLVDMVSADAGFAGAVAVPEGYVDANLAVPRPVGGMLYLKLHDDPGTVQVLRVPGGAKVAKPGLAG